MLFSKFVINYKQSNLGIFFSQTNETALLKVENDILMHLDELDIVKVILLNL